MLPDRLLAGLNPPATEEAVAAAERRLGLALPPDLRAFYLRSDGAAETRFENSDLYVYPLEELLRMRAAAEDDPPYVDIADDRCGSYFRLDLATGAVVVADPTWAPEEAIPLASTFTELVVKLSEGGEPHAGGPADVEGV
jgi:cell wall assembly regulator SMI1